MRQHNDFSPELNSVIQKINDTLVIEYPCKAITIEYILAGILETRNSHAYIIFDKCLMSNNLSKLRNTYTDVLSKHHPNENGLIYNQSDIEPDEELMRLISLAYIERDKTAAPCVSTEHLILALLNPENGFQQMSVLNECGLEYNFILTKCSVNKQRFINKQNNNRNPMQIPLKSQVNVKALSTKNSFIEQFTFNLNHMVKEGKIDKIYGREHEINEVIKTMARRTKNNAILVGPGGCGKTHIINGIAHKLVEGDVPAIIKGKEIVMLNIMALVAGTQLRGMFEERTKNLFSELQSSDRYILFIDDIQTVLKNGSKEKDSDMSDTISHYLNEKNIIVLATAEPKAYRNSIENNPSISRKFRKIQIEAPTAEETTSMLINNKDYYENHHNVIYTNEALQIIPKLAERYITTRSLPDSAFDIIDMAGARRCLINNEPPVISELKNRLRLIHEKKHESLNVGNFEIIDELNLEENDINRILEDHKRMCHGNNITKHIIDEIEIKETVSEITQIPINSLSVNEKRELAHIDKTLKECVIGQDDAIDKICKSIKRNRVGLGDKNRIMSAFLCIGQSGCGKSLVAKELAKRIFGSEKNLIRIDMSEYSEKSSISKLIGSAPGYVGYENGGQLTEAIKNKQYCVLLLDEIEKANQEVYNIFLQLLDEGRLTDSSGQLVNFKNVIVMMTSNVGAKQAASLGGGLGFNPNEEENKKAIYEKELKKRFSPEFLNRIDQIVYFNNLNDDNLRKIVELEANKFKARLNDLNFDIEFNNEVIDYLHKKAVDQKEYGARPIIRLVQDYLEDTITDLMLENEYPEKYIFKATLENDKIEIR